MFDSFVVFDKAYQYVIAIVQQASKDIAKEREALEKAKRAKEVQEKRERERQEKIARTNALVDINGGMLFMIFFCRGCLPKLLSSESGR